MHYKDGTPAAIGDEVVCLRPYGGHPISGVVIQTHRSDQCNLTVAIAKTWTPAAGLKVLGFEHLTLTARDCERADLMANRLAAEKAAEEASQAKRDELAGEVLELFDEPDGPAHDHGELSG